MSDVLYNTILHTTLNSSDFCLSLIPCRSLSSRLPAAPPEHPQVAASVSTSHTPEPYPAQTAAALGCATARWMVWSLTGSHRLRLIRVWMTHVVSLLVVYADVAALHSVLIVPSVSV